MAEDLLNVLTRFHLAVVAPDIERIVESKIESKIAPFQREVVSGFDAVFSKLNRLETECQSLTAAFGRVEDRIASLETRMDEVAVRTELLELRERVQALEQRIAELESQL